MIIRTDLIQGTPEWFRARAGIPTASGFDEFIKPSTGTPRTGEKPFKYLCKCVAEYMMGGPLDDGDSIWMTRGRKMETEAIAWYELERDIDVQRVGLILRDDKAVGCSPDGLVGEDGGIEVKVPGMKQHVAYMIEPQRLVDKYRCQVQGMLWITGRPWWDMLSYNPGIHPVCVRVERDERFIGAMASCVESLMVKLHETLVRFGFKRAYGDLRDEARLRGKERKGDE